jgi:hypothetical protein
MTTNDDDADLRALFQAQRRVDGARPIAAFADLEPHPGVASRHRPRTAWLLAGAAVVLVVALLVVVRFAAAPSAMPDAYVLPGWRTPTDGLLVAAGPSGPTSWASLPTSRLDEALVHRPAERR